MLKKLAWPIVGLHFRRHISVIIETTHSLIHFPHWTMRVKSSASETSAKTQAVAIHDGIKVPLMTTKTSIAFVNHPSEWNTTGTVTPVGKFTEAACLLISHPMSTIFDKKIAVRVRKEVTLSNQEKQTNCRLLCSYSRAIQVRQAVGHGNLQFDSTRWSGLDYVLEQSTQNKQTRSAEQYLMDPDTEDLGEIEDHTRTQTRILEELHEMEEKKVK